MKSLKSLKCLTLIVLLLASMQLISCNDYKQFKTYSNMQLMAAYIRENLSKADWTPEKMQAEIEKINSGKDAWGNRVILIVEEKGYLLVSPGSDGRVDVDDLAEYFLMEERNIHGDSAQDIVFRNGFAVTNAGK